MEVTWHSFDLLSGRRGQQVTVQTLGAFGRKIGEPTDTQIQVMCWDTEQGGPVPGWEAATDPGRTMLVPLDENEQPVGGYGAMVLRRRSGPGAWVTLDVATHEAYFDRRFVKDHDWKTGGTFDQSSVIATGLIGDATALGVQFTIDAPASGIKRERTYADDEDKTVLSVMQELMAVERGPEFTVDLEWADADRLVMNRVVRVRNRIGRPMDLPDAVFEMPGSVTGFEYLEDYTSEHGANSVKATSSGQGDARPESDEQVASELIAAGWATYERRFTPSTSITRKSRLNSHARAELAAMKYGLRELKLETHLPSAPRIGEDIHLGDDASVVLTCERFPALTDADGAVTPGYEKNLRLTGWDIDIDAGTFTPNLIEVDD